MNGSGVSMSTAKLSVKSPISRCVRPRSDFGEFSVFIGNCSAESIIAAIMHISSARSWHT